MTIGALYLGIWCQLLCGWMISVSGDSSGGEDHTRYHNRDASLYILIPCFSLQTRFTQDYAAVVDSQRSTRCCEPPTGEPVLATVAQALVPTTASVWFCAWIEFGQT